MDDIFKLTLNQHVKPRPAPPPTEGVGSVLDPDWRTNYRGAKAVRFISKLTLVGDHSGRPFELREWQESFIRQLLGTVKPDGKRLYTDAFLFIPRKNAKTTLIAALGLYFLVAEGKSGQAIFSAASSREQAGIIFNTMRQMILSSPFLNSICEIQNNRKEIWFHARNNCFRSLAYKAGSNHGLNPSVVLCDELHTFQGEQGRHFWQALTTGSGAREEPLFLTITTAGESKLGVCYEQYQHSKNIQNGIVEDPTRLVRLYEASEDDDWKSPETWKKANPALGDFLSLDYLKRKVELAASIPSEELSFRKFHLNQWVSSDSSFITPHLWEQNDSRSLDIDAFKGCTCYAGLDLSSKLDMSAFVLMFPLKDDSFAIFPYYWLPSANIAQKEYKDKVPYRQWAREGHLCLSTGESIDQELILHQVAWAKQRFKLKGVYADPFQGAQLLTDLGKLGVPVKAFAQNFTSMSEPTKELQVLTVERKLYHQGNPVLAWNVANATVISNANADIRLVKKASSGRIDGLISLVMALGGYMADNLKPGGSYRIRRIK